jgi:hypothetical protein
MVIRKDVIIYPIFLECCQYTEDIYWKNIFEDLAYGKSPYGTYISKDFLCCKYKGREFSYSLLEKDSKVLFDDIYQLFTNKLSILSNQEKNKKRIDFNKIEDNMYNNNKKTWSDIKKKNIKDLLIELYVIDSKNKYELTYSQSRYLLSIIFIAMIFKSITAKDIHYEKGVITHIDGIDFTKGNIILKRNIYDFEINTTPELIIDKPLMSDNWDKYIESLEKQYNIS